MTHTRHGRWIGLALCWVCGVAAADDEPADKTNLAAARLDVMRARAESIVFTSPVPGFPVRLNAAPVFRYDDETRGYVDGTVWRLGDSGRPLAIITTELHPNYLGGGPRVVYDFLCLTDRRFTAKSKDVPGWSPPRSAVAMQPLDGAPVPAATATARLAQLKQQARRFTGTQEVQERETQHVHLRLLPREIDRYAPGSAERADGAIFLLVNGRNPALVLLVETDGEKWQWGVGRLTLPSNLELRLDDRVVWAQPRNPPYGWASPYCASNSPAEFP
jgi:hypothetical protein